MFNTFESVCSCFVVHLYNCFPVPSNSSDGQSYNTVAYRVIHILLDRVRVCPQTHYIVYSNVGRGSYYCSPFSMHTCDECERYVTQLHGKQNCPPCVRPRQPASATNMRRFGTLLGAVVDNHTHGRTDACGTPSTAIHHARLTYLFRQTFRTVGRAIINRLSFVTKSFGEFLNTTSHPCV